MEFDYGKYGYIALKNLKSAERNLGIDADVVVYNSQQAVEKMLKQFIQHNYFEADIENILHTHKLHILVNKSKINKLKEYRAQISELSDYYFNGRDPGICYKEVDNDKAKELYNSANEIVNIIIDNISQSKSNTELNRMNL